MLCVYITVCSECIYQMSYYNVMYCVSVSRVETTYMCTTVSVNQQLLCLYQESFQFQIVNILENITQFCHLLPSTCTKNYFISVSSASNVWQLCYYLTEVLPVFSSCSVNYFYH